jgi:hypothetical protein
MPSQSEQEGAAPILDLVEWLTQLSLHLPADTATEVGPEERSLLLDLARVAAHRSQRTAAPITTYVVGLALATVPVAERRSWLAQIVERLDVSVR